MEIAKKLGWIACAVVVALLCAMATAALLGCSGAQERPACSYQALGELESAYITEVLEQCNGQHFDTCDARLKLDKKYDELRKEWVHCQ